MVEGGADIRYVQELLGHRDLSSTHIYTRVAPERLAAIHAATHPGAVLPTAKDDTDTDDADTDDTATGETATDATDTDVVDNPERGDA
jgi:integrase/recombinase XerD